MGRGGEEEGKGEGAGKAKIGLRQTSLLPLPRVHLSEANTPVENKPSKNTFGTIIGSGQCRNFLAYSNGI